MLPVWRDGEEESSDVESIVDLTGDAEDEPFHSGASAATTTNFKLKSLITPTASVDSNVQGNPSNPERVVREVGTYPSLPSSMFDHFGIQRVVREVGGVDKRSSTSSASSLSTDGVEFITNPTADEVTRPAKRSKGSSEGDVEIMGSIGMVLPHNRFSCPEYTFVEDDTHGHEDCCKLCFCYVCDKPASDCMSWSRHCDAVNTGPAKEFWAFSRAQAKKRQQLGKIIPGSRLPVSGPSVPGASGKSSASRISAASPGSGALSYPNTSSPSSTTAKPNPLEALPNSCNCEELCKPVHKVITFVSPEGCILRPTVAVAYFNDLTEEKTKHVEEISVRETVRRTAQRYERDHSSSFVKRSATRKKPTILELEKSYMPYLRKVASGQRFHLTIYARDYHRQDANTPPWTRRWMPGSTISTAVRLGKIARIGFKLVPKAKEDDKAAKRKAYFDRFLTSNPVPQSLLTAMPSCMQGSSTPEWAVVVNQPSDEELLEELARGYRSKHVDLEAVTEFDPDKNSGNISIEVILLPKVKHAETTRKTTTPGNPKAGVDGQRRCISRVGEISPSAASEKQGKQEQYIYIYTPRERSKRSALPPSPTSRRPNTNTSASASAPTPATLQLRGASSVDAVDYLMIVERAVLSKTCGSSKRSQSTSSPSSKKSSSSSSAFSSTSAAGSGAALSAPVANGDVSGWRWAGASARMGKAAGGGSMVGGGGHKFTPSTPKHGGRASLDVSLSGLIKSVRAEEKNPRIRLGQIFTPAKLLIELENVKHGALMVQPECLTVQLYEHQRQDTQWMYDQEMLEGGSMRHVWAELPPHPYAPESGARNFEFRRCWFSPILNLFTLVNPFQTGMKGGILCDEMGLGKTAATLALHLVNPAKTPADGVPLDEGEWGPIVGKQARPLQYGGVLGVTTETPGTVVSKGTLVVCKVSLVGQWVEEAKRLCGGALKIYPYHGCSRKKNPKFLAQFDLVVTTYGVVQADMRRNRGFPPLCRIRWWRVVLDESHVMANESNSTQDANCLVSNRRWCMTGTPYNLKFSDVKGQLNFIGIGGVLKDKDLGDSRPEKQAQAQTVALLRRVLLRHSQGMKLNNKNILGLPGITHEVEEVVLTWREREAYEKFEKVMQERYMAVRHRLRYERGSHTMAVLTVLSKFRQACSGGQLLLEQSTAAGGCSNSGGGGDAASASMDAFCPVCNELVECPVKTKCGHTFCQGCIETAITKDGGGVCPKCYRSAKLDDLVPVGGGDNWIPVVGGVSGAVSALGGAKQEPIYSDYGDGAAGHINNAGFTPGSPGVLMETKLKTLVQKLTTIHQKDPTSKSLVFSQFNTSLEWLKHALPKRGFQFRTLNGSMTMRQRADALKAFSNDPPTTVFLLSVRAGAVGINLTQANNVFLLEPLLNLALEKQAVGRVHRLGQARPVKVTKLVLKDSIETRILALQEQQATQCKGPSGNGGSGSGGSGSGGGGGASSSGVAGNIAYDTAKELKIEEYNAIFGVDNISQSSPSTYLGSAPVSSSRPKASELKGCYDYYDYSD
ncbi:unnamed protein product [Ascophyllum nodosum]